MKNRKLLTSLLSVGIVILIASFLFINQNESKYVPREDLSSLKTQEISGSIEWINARKLNQNTNTVSLKDLVNARNQVNNLAVNKATSSIDLEWSELGPDNVGGRTKALIFDKDNVSTLYAGGINGGLWKSTTQGQSWVSIASELSVLTISSICQASNGDIYVGTGDGLLDFSGEHGNASAGNGIWKSTDSGSSWTHLSATMPSTDTIYADITSPWSAINKLSSHPTDANKIFAATQGGLFITTDGGTTWNNVLTDANANERATDVKINSDGTAVIASVNNEAYLSSNGSVGSFTSISGTDSISISTAVGRIEFAFAPSDPNYVYCFAATIAGAFQNIYKSTDKGQTWLQLMTNPTSGVFSPFGANDQGLYNNAIAVYPDNKDRIIIGGIDLYKSNTIYVNDIEQISFWALPSYLPSYVHADIHNIVFSPNYDTDFTFIVGTDGGVYKSSTAGLTYTGMNKKYNVTQFYTVGFSGNDRVIGGTQDNGTQYNDYTGNTNKSFYKVLGSDGGYAEISVLNPEVIFATSKYGNLERSEDNGDNFEGFYDASVDDNQDIGTNAEPFITPIALWENFNDPKSEDYITKYITPLDTTYTANDTVYTFPGVGHVYNVYSVSGKRPLQYTITQADLDMYGGSFSIGDSIKVHDTYQSNLAVALNGRVWITREALDFTKQPPTWYNIVPGGIGYGKGNTIAWSSDGNHLFFADEFNLYRCSNIEEARNDSTMNIGSSASSLTTIKIATFTQIVTGIAVDPEVPSNVVVTLGNYGNTDYVYYSYNATSLSPNFESKQGNLPNIPVYSAFINWDKSKEVFIGTEFGVYSTDDIFASNTVWTSQNGGFPTVPVYMIRQQAHQNSWYDGNTGVNNHGYIYAATFGRGIFKSVSEKGPVAIREFTNKNNVIDNILIYPNPVAETAHVEYNVSNISDVNISIYNIRGKLMKTDKITNQQIGTQTYSFNVNGMEKGTYLISVNVNGKRSVSRFMIF